MPLNIKREKEESYDKINLFISDYTPKSFIVTGDTLEHSKALKELKGTFNPNLQIGAGWIFSKARKESVENYIATGDIKPYVFENYQKSTKIDVEPIFKDLLLAFDSDEEYTGESVKELINKVKEKYDTN